MLKKFVYVFLQDFCKCGIIGWCIEILFTALHSLRCHDFKLKGNTSLWMFPIYGFAAVIRPLSKLFRRFPVWLRGLAYMCCIFTVEYASGQFLKKRKLCPWDYGHSRYQINRVIRLDYAPCWFLTGLLFEHILTCRPHQSYHWNRYPAYSRYVSSDVPPQTAEE